MPSNKSNVSTGALLRDSSWTVNRRVVGALLLRELLTRYGRNNIGFLWLFIEPMLFTLAITIVWSAFRSVHSSSIPIVAFALTGYSSLLMWRNMPGRCVGALKSNMSLLFHRQVTVIDIYTARILLEFMATSTSFVVLGIVFYSMEWLPAPEDPLQVLAGWVLLGWFGAGLALTIGGLSEKFDLVAKLWPPMSYFLMPLSGVAYIADALPQNAREIALYLPMFNALEYLREGWFGSLMTAHYDVGYVAAVNAVLTFAGLSLARQAQLDTSEE
ncbi:ABC transporter permease [Sphingomonas daechungensis]|uniref:ABC transporter permease n=1 Tax=Sphingomonas daechungensis TaxID=1176646 RepID=A0ABX6T047_9SPHN|nr:ABC transporter permease [Sphingomonas daechungensis]QNP42794.1 ABC transporter permease [Sphingomonas daechungensis]